MVRHCRHGGPGCGSLSVDPRFADRLRAEAENSPLRARKIEIAPADDEFEFDVRPGFHRRLAGGTADA